MTLEIAERFEALARSDPTVAPLAALHATALRAAAAPIWEEGVPPLGRTQREPTSGRSARSQIQNGLPLLHGATLAVAPLRAQSLLLELASVAVRAGVPQAESL
ncbi:MAG: hypothetical protein ACRDIB_15260, partial [Ardenticatenaceae bacterium]